MSDVDPVDPPEPVTDLSNANEDEVYSFLLGDVTKTNGKQTSDDFIGGKETLDDGGNLFDDSTVQVGDGACIVCGAPTFRPPGLTKAGHRKRTPKHCDLHSPNIRVQAEGPGPQGMESQLRRIQEELSDDLKLLATMGGPFYPVTAFYMYDNADRFVTALLMMTKNNTRALRVLHRAAQIAPIYRVGEYVAGSALSVQVDMQKHDPHSVVAERLGVSKAYDKVYPEKASKASSNGFTAPPRYATVQ